MDRKQAVERRIQSIREKYPLVGMDLDRTLETLDPETRQILKDTYAGLCIQDLLSLPAEFVLAYAQASRRARHTLPYAASVPEVLFQKYVLPIRVNNEYPDGSRSWLYDQLAERVQGKAMLAAALEVNYWCYEKATYLPSDDRTIGPLGMCRRTRGRCGEESTLLVSALRAVCIPARQCYAPYWAHCDDNHAWVEFWAEGQWHYMGACEPEPEPDAGWFTSAASRAMLVRSYAPDFEAESGQKLVNTTARYAETAFLRVQVSANGMPCGGIPVRFQLVNDCQLKKIYEANTDETGFVTLETGLGCLVVSAYFSGRLIETMVDVRKTREAALRWEDGFDPLAEEQTASWALTPPKERIPELPSEHAGHLARLRRCESVRANYEAGFSDAPWLSLAGGNQAEIARFLDLAAYAQDDKELLLSTLSEKDFADVTCETLESFLSAALPWKGKVPRTLWQREILAPRVEHEPLLPIRQTIQACLAGETLFSAEAVLTWMETHLTRIEEPSPTDRRGNAASYVLHGVCPKSEWDILAVQICRALGIPASLSPVTGRFLPAELPTVRLTLFSDELAMVEKAQFTLARWIGNDYQVLNLSGLPVNRAATLSLYPGAYSLITSRRQIDGTASAKAVRFVLSEDRTVHLTLAPDQTLEKLQSVPLPMPEDLLVPGRPVLLLFLKPGAEPTEHLLQELLELQDAFRRGAWPILILLSQMEETKNATLCKVLSALPESRCSKYQNALRFSVQHSMGLGDSRLPLSVVLDSQGRGVYASANYNIRAGHTLLHILKLIQGEDHASIQENPYAEGHDGNRVCLP